MKNFIEEETMKKSMDYMTPYSYSKNTNIEADSEVSYFNPIIYSSSNILEEENITLNENLNIKPDINTLSDFLHIYNNNLNKKTLKYLLKYYGEKTTKYILKFGRENNSNIQIGDLPLLKSQIEYEVLHRDLKYPLDFILRRHNYMSIFTSSTPNEDIINFLITFAEVNKYTSTQLKNDTIKLLGIKYILT